MPGKEDLGLLILEKRGLRGEFKFPKKEDADEVFTVSTRDWFKLQWRRSEVSKDLSTNFSGDKMRPYGVMFGKQSSSHDKKNSLETKKPTTKSTQNVGVLWPNPVGFWVLKCSLI